MSVPVASKSSYEALRQALIMEGFFDDVTVQPDMVLGEMQRRGWLEGYALTAAGAREAARASRRVALLLNPSRPLGHFELEIVQVEPARSLGRRTMKETTTWCSQDGCREHFHSQGDTVGVPNGWSHGIGWSRCPAHGGTDHPRLTTEARSMLTALQAPLEMTFGELRDALPDHTVAEIGAVIIHLKDAGLIQHVEGKMARWKATAAGLER